MELTATQNLRASPKQAASGAAWWKTWLVPDMALILSLKTLFFFFVTFDGLRMLFRDGDPGWHIVTGEAVLSGRGLPRTEWLSFSCPGVQWVGWEWLVQVTMAALNRVGGLGLVAVFFGLVITACIWIWFRFSLRIGGDFILCCAAGLLLSATFNMHWLARPHVVGWLLLLLTIWWVEVSRPTSLVKTALLAALFGSVWASVHATFLFLIAILAIYSVAHALRPLIWTDLNRGTEWQQARRFGIAALSAAVGTLLTTYGWETHLTVWRVMHKGEGLFRLSEYQPYDLSAEGGYRILALFIITGAGALIALSQRNLQRFAVIVMLLIVSARFARGIPILALVGLPLAIAAVTVLLARLSSAPSAWSRGLRHFLDYSRGLRRVESQFRGYAWLLLSVGLAVAIGLMPGVRAYAGFPPEQFPVAAANAVAALPPDARILATDSYGGYLIYRFGGRRPVFFDSRTDVYPIEIIREYLTLFDLAPGWQRELEKWHFSHALLPFDHPLGAQLQKLGWHVQYRDKTAVLLSRPAAPGN